jgi:ribonuclease T
MFVAWYFHTFLGRNPFGVSGVDIRSLYMGRMRVDWEDSRKDQMIEAVRPKRALSHNALQDARDQGELAWDIMQLP